MQKREFITLLSGAAAWLIAAIPIALSALLNAGSKHWHRCTELYAHISVN
ncbi:MAG: hypothetical protein WCC77_21625 [Pseudolabrys sp.]